MFKTVKTIKNVNVNKLLHWYDKDFSDNNFLQFAEELKEFYDCDIFWLENVKSVDLVIKNVRNAYAYFANGKYIFDALTIYSEN